jgi:hypothetical protein
MALAPMPQFVAEISSRDGLHDFLGRGSDGLPDEALEERLANALGADAVEGLNDVEDFLGTLAQIGQAIVKALPVVLPVVGSVLGPVGAVAGGAAGSAIGVATQAGPPATAKPPAGSRRSGRRRRPQPVPAGSPAAAQLLALLFRPEIQQALVAMILGDLGRRTVRAGDTPVPVAAFVNLLGVLAQQAALEYGAAVDLDGEAVPRYLLTDSGEAVCDLAVPEARATRVWNLMQRDSESATVWPDDEQAWLAMAIEAWTQTELEEWDDE